MTLEILWNRVTNLGGLEPSGDETVANKPNQSSQNTANLLWTTRLQDQVERAWHDVEKRNASSAFVSNLKKEHISEREINSLFADALNSINKK